MAAKQSTVELIFQGVDRTGEATQAALRNAQSFTQSLQGVTAPVANATKQAVKFEAALLAGGAAITAFSIKAAGDFDSAFREIATLIDEPIENLGGFRDAILDYSQTSTQSLEQITGSVYSAISAGVDYTQSLDAVAQAEQLAVAGKADLNDTLTVLVSSLNAYGLEMDEAERFSDALFTTVKQGQTTLPELGSALSQVTGLAASAGVDFEELLSAVAALTAAGAPTSQAITQIRQALANIINPTQQARDLAGDLGIEFGAAALESRGLSGVLDDVAEATGGNTEQMSQLFGSVQALGGVLTLTGEGADAFSDTLVAMEDNAGATGDAFERMSGQVSEQNQRVANSLRALAVEIGGPLLDQYGGVTDALTAVFQAVGANVRDGQLGDLVGVVETILADTESVFRSMAENMTEALESADLSGFERGIEALRDGIQNLFSNQDLSTTEGLADAMTTLADAFAGLSQFTAGVIESFQFLFDMMVKAGSSAADLDDSMFRLLGRFGGVTTQVNLLLPLLNALLAVMIVKKSGLVGAAKATALAMGSGGLAGALGKAGLVGATGLAVVEIGKLIGILWDWHGAAQEASESQALMNEVVGRSESELQKVAQELGLTVSSYDEFFDMVDRGAVVFDEAAGRWVLASEKQREAVEGLGRDYEAEVNAMTEADDMARESKRLLTEAFADQGLEWDAATGKIGDGKQATEEATESQERWVRTMEDGVATFTQVGEVFGGAMEGAKTEMEEVTKKSDELQIALEELASNERIKYMEFNAQMNIAELEADAEKTKAVFGSIDNAINNTGELIGGLFDSYVGADSLWEQSKIESQIRKENEHRDRQFELQERMTKAHIKEIEARTKRLQDPDPMIKIEGDGLQPHLEAFMWEILRTIQVRVNQDGLEMLTGV